MAVLLEPSPSQPRVAFSSPLVLVFSEVAAAQQPRYLGSASTLPRATGSMPPGHRTTSGASPAPMPRSSPWQPNFVVRSHAAPASPQRHRAAAELRRSRAASRTSAGASAPSAPSSPSAPGCRRGGRSPMAICTIAPGSAERTSPPSLVGASSPLAPALPAAARRKRSRTSKAEAACLSSCRGCWWVRGVRGR